MIEHFQTIRRVLTHPLNHHRRMRALVHFARWQLGSRLVPGQVVVNWIDGARFLVSPGETGMTGNVYLGLHEFSDMAFVLHATTSADLFVDIGANVGSYTILACAARGAHGVCFEPVPTTYAKLVDNIRINDATARVSALNMGLAEMDGELPFTSGMNCLNHVVLKPGPTDTVIKIPVTTLDRALDGRKPTIIKIDVEGFEMSVLRGGQKTLADPALHSVIMELNGSGSRYGQDEGEIAAFMQNLGFSPYSYAPFTRHLEPLSKKNEGASNTIFIRDIARVQELIAASRPIAIHGRSF